MPGMCRLHHSSQSLPTCRAQAARQARQAGQSDKRRKMQQDLARREEAWQTERSAEQQASSRLKVGCKVCWGGKACPWKIALPPRAQHSAVGIPQCRPWCGPAPAAGGIWLTVWFFEGLCVSLLIAGAHS